MADDEDRNLDDVDGEISSLYSEMMEINFKIIRRSRRQAERLEAILELYAEQIQRLSELRNLHIESARALSDTVGDILTAEWDIDDPVHSGEDDDDDDEEEEDDGA